MQKRTSDNLRIKRRYLDWLRQAKGLSEATVDKAAAAIDRWTDYTNGADRRRFHPKSVSWAMAWRLKIGHFQRHGYAT